MGTPLNFQTILIMKKQIAIALLSFLTSNIAVLNAVLCPLPKVKKTPINCTLSEMKEKVKNGLDINRSFDGNTFLTIKAFERNLEAVDWALKNGADVNKQDSCGRTPLVWALSRDNDYNNYKLVKRILEEDNVDVDLQTYSHLSPLWYARDKIDYVKLLVEKGANINAKNSYHGTTALHDFIKYWDCNEAVNYLLQRGADVNIKDKYGRKPSYYCRKDKNRYYYFRSLETEEESSCVCL